MSVVVISGPSSGDDLPLMCEGGLPRERLPLSIGRERYDFLDRVVTPLNVWVDEDGEIEMAVAFLSAFNRGGEEKETIGGSVDESSSTTELGRWTTGNMSSTSFVPSDI